jgi:hypothetical protein
MFYGREKRISDWAWPKHPVLGSTFAWCKPWQKQLCPGPPFVRGYISVLLTSFLLSDSGSLEQRWLPGPYRRRGIFHNHHQTLWMFWLPLLKLPELWTNGYYGWIWQVRKV